MSPPTPRAERSRPRASVVVPSYRRPAELHRCLSGLAAQRTMADEVIVVARQDDGETQAVVRGFPLAGTRLVLVAETGVLAAMRAGVSASTGDVVAFVDDDAVPGEDWLQRLLDHLAVDHVGGAGGRDLVAGQDCRTTDVGRVTPFGRVIGNHHLGTGAARDVDVLKGVNMAFRREALALPARLRGSGAQVHWELATSQWAKARGWRLVYDPTITVDHRPAVRFDADQRGAPNPEALIDAAYNYERALLAARPELHRRRVVHGMIIGQRDNPGLLRAAAAAVSRDWPIARRLRPSLEGRWSGLRAAARGPALEMITFDGRSSAGERRA